MLISEIISNVYKLHFVVQFFVVYLGFMVVSCLMLLTVPIAYSPAILENRVASAQCLSGTGSLRVGTEFLARHYNQVCLICMIYFIIFKTNILTGRWDSPVYLYSAHNIHSTTNMGKPSESLHLWRAKCKGLPILWPSNSGSRLTRFEFLVLSSFWNYHSFLPCVSFDRVYISLLIRSGLLF